jgi:hypothetical protein
MTVDPAFLEGDPIGPQIPLLDDVDPQGAGFGDAYRGAVQGPAIAEQDDVADLAFDDQPIEELRPFFRTAAKIRGSRQSPECSVTAIKIYPVNRMAALGERLSEALEEAGRHALEEKKAPPGVN